MIIRRCPSISGNRARHQSQSERFTAAVGRYSDLHY